MNRAEFEDLIKDVVSNLYDYAALEGLPNLNTAFPSSGKSGSSRSDSVREIVQSAIEQIRPPGKPNPSAPDWRPYLILHHRYIEGANLQELAEQLAISPRQLRRDHHRGLQTLTAMLWERLGQSDTALSPTADANEPSFEIHRESIDLSDTLTSVHKMLDRHLEEEGIRLELSMDQPPLTAFTDRIILRQILISLINHAAQLLLDDALILRIQRISGGVEIHLMFNTVPDTFTQLDGESDETIDQARYWCDQIEANFEEIPHGQSVEFVLALPAAEKKVILVVDDQEPAINMFRRYLSRSNFTILGVTQPTQVLESARKHHPALITLDVMMPLLDGWEILQALKLDEQTAHIPVLICSAWEEPELSRSLGAAGFLKKPVTQKDFLTTLENLGLLS